jgi:hypothetical protein
MTVLATLFLIGWIAAASLGSLAYFLGERTKPIHARNWRSASFEKLAEAITGAKIDYANRVPAFSVADAYGSSTLSDR